MNGFSRVSVLLAIVAAVILMVVIAAGPGMKAASIGTEIELLERRVMEQRALLQSRIRNGESGSSDSKDTLRTQHLIAGTTTGIAGANLQKLLSDLLARHGGSVASIQLLTTRDDGELTVISARLSLRVGLQGLRAIVHQLEAGVPLLFIDSISMRAESREAQAADPFLRTPLEVAMQVSGYMRRQGGT